jgi:benzoate membrane transport protein
MIRHLEQPLLPLPGLRRIMADLAPVHAASALVAFVFAASGPIAIILAVGTRGGLSEAELSSWIFGAFFFNGLLSIGFCLAWRQPLVFFWTIPGTVLVGPALDHLTFPQVIGAFYATGVLMLVLGLSGWVRRAMEAVPMPIVMGMVAGVFLRFGLDWVLAFRDGFWIAATMTVAFIGVSAWTPLARLCPPLIAALAVGIGVTLALGAFAPDADLSFTLARPVLQAPVFSWQALVELVVPLAITVLVVQNGQGIAILTAAGHRPPINAIATACGAVSLLCAAVGTASTCLTGPVNAIISASGEKPRQYTAGIVVGLLALAFGLLAPMFTRFMLSTPAAFIATLAGLAMLRVLQNAFTVAFRGKFTLGALVTFLVTVSGIAIANIGAPFWGLVFGFAVSWLLEREDFRSGAAPA